MIYCVVLTNITDVFFVDS